MALIFPGSRCALCRRTLVPGESFFATSGVAFPPSDPLFPACDAPIHWDCYAEWPERRRFARGYFRSFASNPYWVVVLSDDDVEAAIGDEVIRIHLAEIGGGEHVALGDWDAWIARQPEDGPHAIYRAAIERVLERLRALGSAAELRAKGVSPEARAELKARARAEALAGYARRHRARCTTCRAKRRDHAFVGVGERLQYRCAACGGNFEIDPPSGF